MQGHGVLTAEYAEYAEGISEKETKGTKVLADGHQQFWDDVAEVRLRIIVPTDRKTTSNFWDDVEVVPTNRNTKKQSAVA